MQTPPLPYAQDALMPHIGAETLCFIEQKILPKWASAVQLPKSDKGDGANADKNTQSARRLLRRVYAPRDPNGDPSDDRNARLATELYNHYFWLAHLSPKKQTPSDAFLAALLAHFGSLDKIHDLMQKAAACPDARWVWLAKDVQNPNAFAVVATANRPLEERFLPLAVCNLWQHAYYLDYRDRVGDYLSACFWRLTHWQNAERAWLSDAPWLWKD